MKTRIRDLSPQEQVMAGEYFTFKRLITEVYPAGIVSLVSDTYNLWDVLTKIAPSLKEEILNRDGKVVFRPDSGDPVKIICGYSIEQKDYGLAEAFYRLRNNETLSYEEVIHCRDNKYLRLDDQKEIGREEALGAVRLLDEQFGHTVNSKGYKELCPSVGLIYGDSITYERAQAICDGLKDLGYASNNIVLGVGSFSYQYNTRDTFSIACKATYVEVDGKSYDIFKDPVTDDGTKKSACGLLKVERVEGAHGSELVLRDQVSWEEEEQGELIPVFQDGELLIDYTFNEVKNNLYPPCPSLSTKSETEDYSET